jgi:hypothetical protein
MRQAAVGFVLLALVALAQAAESPADVAALMRGFAARAQGHARFVERKTLAVLDRPVESSGELFYTAPDRLEKRTLKPQPESLSLEAGQLRVQRGKRRYSLSLRDAPDIAPFIDSLRATLAGDLAALERSYTLRYEPQATGWTLLLTPRDVRLARTIARIRLAGSGAQLDEVTIDSADGDRSVMTIQELPAS